MKVDWASVGINLTLLVLAGVLLSQYIDWKGALGIICLVLYYRSSVHD